MKGETSPMYKLRSIIFILLVTISATQCTAPVQPGDTTPPTVSMKIFINGESVESGSDIEYTAEYGDEIKLYAVGYDQQGLMCVKIWGTGFRQECHDPNGSGQCITQPTIPPPFCDSDKNPGDEVKTTLAYTQVIKIDSSPCEHSCPSGPHLYSESNCRFAFAKNFGSGPDEETKSQSPNFCYEYRAD